MCCVVARPTAVAGRRTARSSPNWTRPSEARIRYALPRCWLEIQQIRIQNPRPPSLVANSFQVLEADLRVRCGTPAVRGAWPPIMGRVTGRSPETVLSPGSAGRPSGDTDRSPIPVNVTAQYHAVGRVFPQVTARSWQAGTHGRVCERDPAITTRFNVRVFDPLPTHGEIRRLALRDEHASPVPCWARESRGDLTGSYSG